MKTILLFGTLFFAQLLSAQLIIQVDGEGADVSGTIVEVDATPSSIFPYEKHFIVSNNSGSDVQWRITRVKQSVPSAWTDQVCWPPNCYVANGDIYVTPHSGGNPAPILKSGKVIAIEYDFSTGSGSVTITINGSDYIVNLNTSASQSASDFVANESGNIFSTHGITLTNSGAELIFDCPNPLIPLTITDETGDLTAHFSYELKPRITPDQSANSSGTYMYYITDLSGNFIDSVGLRVNFTLGIEEEIIEPLAVEVTPNPATEYVTIQTKGTSKTSVKMVDALGNIVYNETLTIASNKIDISTFRNGVYFVIVESEDNQAVNRRVIVRH